MWFIVALYGAFFKSLSGYNRKKVSHLSSDVFAWIQSFVAAIILLPLAFIFKTPVFELIVHHPFIMLGITLTTLAGTVMNIKALSKEDLSFVAPLNGLIPIIGVVFGVTILGEIPATLGLLGIVIIFLGTYVMALKPSRSHWYDPFMRLSRSSAARLSLGVAIAYTLNTVFIKMAANAGYSALTISCALTLACFVLLSYIFVTHKRREILPAITNYPVNLLASSVNSLLGSYLHNLAVSMTLVSYALAVRRFDIVFSVLLGWKFLKESGIRYKFVGGIIIVIGVALIALYS